MDREDARKMVEAMMIARDEGKRRGGESVEYAANICFYVIGFLGTVDPDGSMTDAIIDAELARRPADAVKGAA